jgi:hypothetical protein
VSLLCVFRAPLQGTQKSYNVNVFIEQLSANVPFYQLATQTDAAGTRVLIKDTLSKKCVSTFDVWC